MFFLFFFLLYPADSEKEAELRFLVAHVGPKTTEYTVAPSINNEEYVNRVAEWDVEDAVREEECARRKLQLKYVGIGVVVVGILSAGIYLLIHYLSLPNSPHTPGSDNSIGICSSKGEGFGALEHRMLPPGSIATQLGTLFQNLNQSFFSTMSILCALSSSHANITSCIEGDAVFQRTLSRAEEELEMEVDQNALLETIKDKDVGGILCEVIGNTTFSCYPYMLLPQMFDSIKGGSICPGMGEHNASGPATMRFFFYNAGNKRHQQRVQKVFSFDQANRIVSTRISDKTFTQSRPVSLSESGSSSQSVSISNSESGSSSQSVSISNSESGSLSQSVSRSKSDSPSQSGSLSVSASQSLIEWLANTTNTTYVWNLVTANGAAGSPPRRYAHAMNVIGKNLYVFGGWDWEANHLLNDMWKFNGSAWVNITPPGINPTPRCNFVSSSVSSYIYVFGGAIDRTNHGSNDLWRFDTILGTWTQLTENGAIGSPPLLVSACGGTIGNDFYVFGGFSDDEATSTHNLWQFNGFRWFNVTPAVSPFARSECVMTTATERQSLYLFGGYSGGPRGSHMNDLWQYDGSSWFLISPNTTSPISPTRRADGAIGSLGQKIFVFGGTVPPNGGNDLWEFNTITSTWEELIPNAQPGSPEHRYYTGALCNIGSDFYLFGGYDPRTDARNDLWKLQTSITAPNVFYLWDLLIANGTVGSPPPRVTHSMNTIGNDLYVFGGCPGLPPCYNDIWKFDGIKWKNVTPTTINPSARSSFASGVIGSDIYMYGGGDGAPSSATNDLWKFDTISETWVKLIVNGLPGSPPISWSCAGTTTGNTFYIFSGAGYASYTKDLWKYNGSAWADVTPAVSPSTRNMATMTTVGTDMYMWGGCNTGCSNSLWRYDRDSNWTLITPNNWTLPFLPGGQYGQMMSSIGQELFILGGANVGSCTQSNFWKFDIASSTWERIPSVPLDSTGRLICFYSAAMCNMGDDLYLFGGQNQNPSGISGPRNDLWRMHKISIGLSDIDVAPNPIVMNHPFNFSWQVQTIRGSDEHVATINFNGTKNYTSTYSNALASITLTSPEVASDFWINLQVQDRLYPRATVNQTIQFRLQKP